MDSITKLGINKLSGAADDKSTAFSIGSSCPGLLFLLAGVALICFALFKQIEYQDKTVVPYDMKPPPPTTNENANKKS
jgi:hypothetical protein